MQDEQQINKNRMVLLLIAGIPLTMILASTERAFAISTFCC